MREEPVCNVLSKMFPDSRWRESSSSHARLRSTLLDQSKIFEADKTNVPFEAKK